MFFELVSIIVFAIVPHYGNEYMTKENKIWTSFKNFAPKLNLNHNIYVQSSVKSYATFRQITQKRWTTQTWDLEILLMY